jgi:hypothetical protein
MDTALPAQRVDPQVDLRSQQEYSRSEWRKKWVEMSLVLVEVVKSISNVMAEVKVQRLDYTGFNVYFLTSIVSSVVQ